ncbi:MAG: DNA alkylation repair protein [Symploca sp. SIO2D2]|nr:DNA alkylation repair protein [Symploca sp. SIO2D2]
MNRPPLIPPAPRSIQKGVPLKLMMGPESIECLALNIRYVKADFAADEFRDAALEGLDPLTLMGRGKHIAETLRRFLPEKYEEALHILVESFTPEEQFSEEFGLAEMFYLPHSFFIAEFGGDPKYNDGEDPFDSSMRALYELTKRFTSEFAIREFLIRQQDRTLSRINDWITDPNPHVRRLCSEGTRPKLPWGKRLQSFVKDPKPTLPILEALKNDETLYVRRSVANHLGDIAKDHADLVFNICGKWLAQGASKELKWVMRHAVRHPAKKKVQRALDIRIAAK